jgi:hypothetical protein
VKDFTATHLAWDASYRFSVMTRPYYDPPQTGRVSQMPLHWDDGEMHENKTQIYIMVSGTGSIALGGEPEKRRAAPDGQHSGGPLKGATIQRVNPGEDESPHSKDSSKRFPCFARSGSLPCTSAYGSHHRDRH